MKLFIALLFLSFSLHAKIVETSRFKDLLEHVNEKTLVILDIDDTLLIPKQSLGTDAWFQLRVKEVGLSKAVAEWEAIRHLTEVVLVERGTDKIIEKLQEADVKVMGLSTQALSLSLRTPKQLNHLGICLKKTMPAEESLLFFQGETPVLFHEGILFTGGSPKGTALLTFLEKTGFTPEKVVFINDKLTHLQDVEKAVEEASIPFTGLRYGFLDEKNKAFDPKVADLQFESFRKILSDEAAKELLKSD